MRWLTPLPAALCLLTAPLLPAATHPETVAENAYFYVHTVADVDKSIAFYRDAVGLKTKTVLSSFPTDRLSKNAQINALTNTPGASFRPVYFALPGNSYGFELLEFEGIERKPLQPRLQDPGATFLILEVRNLASTLERVKKTGAVVVSANTNARAVFVRDLDGFYLLLEQARRIPGNAPKGNIVAASVGVVVADTAAAQRFYQDMFGFVPGNAANSVQSLMALTGVAEAALTGVEAQIVVTSAMIPDSTFELQFWEFKGVDHRGIHPRMQDPGAPQFTLQFKEPAPARELLRMAGVEFLSPGVVYDPNGVLILVRGEPPNH
jgi:catechol 2,3-dioxygenase-like lactoylglutathione lyase family enzyme